MTGDELLTFARRDWLRDTALPQLWSDELIYLYLNEGQEHFARRTHAIYNNDLTVNLAAGVTEYDLEPRVLFVFDGYLDGQPYNMRNVTWRKLPRSSTSTGIPTAFSFDEQSSILTVTPAPDQSYTMYLGAAVLPENKIDTTTSPELPEQYHIDLLEWVAYRCLRNNDVDGQKMDTGDAFRATWETRIRDAKREIYRLRMGFDPVPLRSWTGKRGR